MLKMKKNNLLRFRTRGLGKIYGNGSGIYDKLLHRYYSNSKLNQTQNTNENWKNQDKGHSMGAQLQKLKSIEITIKMHSKIGGIRNVETKKILCGVAWGYIIWFLLLLFLVFNSFWSRTDNQSYLTVVIFPCTWHQCTSRVVQDGADVNLNVLYIVFWSEIIYIYRYIFVELLWFFRQEYF